MNRPSFALPPILSGIRWGEQSGTHGNCSGYRIDLGILDPANPGKYQLGVECDGATYHRAATARDRDKLRQAVLEGLGWTLYRIWSTDWWHDSEKEMQKLITFITQLTRP